MFIWSDLSFEKIIPNVVWRKEQTRERKVYIIPLRNLLLEESKGNRLEIGLWRLNDDEGKDRDWFKIYFKT